MGILNIRFGALRFKLVEEQLPDIAARQLRKGTYEAPLPALIIGTVSRTDGMFIDVGANSGVYSVLAAITAPRKNIIAFEPYPPCIKVLKQNIDINGLTDRIEVKTFALSDTAGTATLYTPDKAHGLLETSASLEKDFQPTADSVEIEKRTFDELDIVEPVSVIKVDIEGHEPAFLRGATKTIERDRPIIFVEILAAVKTATFEQFAKEYRYQTFRLREGYAISSPTVAFDINAWNWAFVPEEQVSLFEAICVEAGISLVPADHIIVAKRNIYREVRSFLGRSYTSLVRAITAQRN